MNKEAIIGIGIGMLLFVGVAFLARPTVKTGENTVHNAVVDSTQNQLVASESTYAFGSISMKNGKVNREYTIKNTSNATMTINKVYTSCMCTEAMMTLNGKTTGPYKMPGHGGVQTISEVIKPGEVATLKAIFDPNAHGPAGVGPITRQVIVETTDGNKSTFTFSANVTP